MKKLTLKEVPCEVKPTEAEIIYENAKDELKKVICKYAGALYVHFNGKMPNFGDNENVTIEVSQLCEDIFVEVAPAGFKEPTEVRRITCFLDNSVIVEDADGNEFDTLSLTELARIADTMEKTYRPIEEERLLKEADEKLNKYVILYLHPHKKVWEPYRWMMYSDDIIFYDTYHQALHDCHKGEKIMKYSKYLAEYATDKL